MSKSLSISIITFNEEANIGRTIESVARLADEIIVVDSHSSDRTREIAIAMGAKVFDEDWKGHIAQKNSALAKCSCDWVLSIDADEVVSPELLEEIRNALPDGNIDGYYINRKTHYLGRLLEHAWQPDWNLRLVRLGCAPKWDGLDPHDRLEISSKRTKKMRGHIVHYSYTGIAHHFVKTIDYARISAKSYMAKGRKATFANLTINPIYAFLRLYFADGGWRDGTWGLIAAFSSMTGTFLKYAFLWDLQRNSDD